MYNALVIKRYKETNLILILTIFISTMAAAIGIPYNNIQFKLFCHVCEDIRNAKTEKKMSRLKEFISKYRGLIENSDNINIVSQLILDEILELFIKYY